MVSIVPLQRRTEAASAAAAAARSIFSSPYRDEEEGFAAGAMDLSGTQGDLAIPMHATAAVSPYGGAAGGHALQLHHHEQQHGHGTSSNNGQSPSPAEEAEGGASATKKRGGGPAALAAPAVRYRECLKNHAAAIGGSATDGCGEFMPSGEDGSLEALKCSACGCHRNFHRKELDGDADDDDVIYSAAATGHRRLLAPAMPYRGNTAGAGGLLVSAATAAADPYAAYAAAARALPPPPPPPGHGHGHGHPHHPHHHGHHQYVMPLSMVHNNSESDEMDGGVGGGGGGGSAASAARKRFRTKFSPEQKARMLEFAERVGWRLQKLEEGMVEGFCHEIGVKRRVLKVWMHNNKHSLATTRRIDMEASPAAAGISSPPVASSQMPPLQMVPPAGVMPPAMQAAMQGAGPSCGSPAPQPGLKLE
ncbi:unnamed protein product [Urochloa decumbens]|uniref:ZF-HD dimerization-type domain-containing protein n=1 Tax=Urochloa decumbens TaxID=240449 RepID=A0ABC9B5Q1_9POAL